MLERVVSPLADCFPFPLYDGKQHVYYKTARRHPLLNNLPPCQWRNLAGGLGFDNVRQQTRGGVGDSLGSIPKPAE